MSTFNSFCKRLFILAIVIFAASTSAATIMCPKTIECNKSQHPLCTALPASNLNLDYSTFMIYINGNNIESLTANFREARAVIGSGEIICEYSDTMSTAQPYLIIKNYKADTAQLIKNNDAWMKELNSIGCTGNTENCAVLIR